MKLLKKKLATLVYTIRGYNRAMTRMRLFWTGACLVVGFWAVGLSAQTYVPHRVFDSSRGEFSDFEAMLAVVSKADVVLVGEQHDDPNTHRLEQAILEGLRRRRGDVILSLEMFERDVQGQLDAFGRGEVSEETFLAGARPWPRYATDYKPLVDFAMAHQWPVVAANIPRPMASEIGKLGIDVLQSKPEAERAWFASDWTCPETDAYFARFKEVMGAHPSEPELVRFYAAQCLKDETMAESITRAWQGASTANADVRPLVVHYNGAFHSDYGLGTAARVQSRMPAARVVVISTIPVSDLDHIDIGDHLDKGDYLLFTIK